jgi:hypothetical protein
MNLRVNLDTLWKRPIIMYLVIFPGGPKEKEFGTATVQPPEKFHEMVRSEVKSFLVEGKEPPVEIAAAIKNISDDVKSGRDPVIRAGDYITLMGYARSKKLV